MKLWMVLTLWLVASVTVVPIAMRFIYGEKDGE